MRSPAGSSTKSGWPGARGLSPAGGADTAFRELERLNAELERSNAELERSNAELAQFAHVASHDLSEPLRMVTSYLQLLADGYRGRLDSDADEYIEFAVDGARRMRALIDDLLAYSRAGQPPRRNEQVDCDALVAAVVSDLQPTVLQVGAKVTVGALPTVEGDRIQLGQVFANLVSNALKFHSTEQRPTIDVGVQREPTGWSFSVEDNGIGVPAHHAERIFGMFKRLHARDACPGTGIGLTLCRRIVEAHGGRIWCEAGAAGGTVLRFTLPDGGIR